MRDFTKEEIRLFDLIAESFINLRTQDDPDVNMHEIILLAYHHSVLPIIYEPLKKCELSYSDKEIISQNVKEIASGFYRLIFAARDITHRLTEGGVSAVLLKGASVARFYRIPEARRSSDVDILLADPKDIGRTGEILSAAGFRRKKESADDFEANHHEVWIMQNGTVAEIHTQIVEPFAQTKLNDYLADRFRLGPDDIDIVSVLNFELPVLKDDRQAFHLLEHMVMDFYRTGFGLKLLCDWAVFWNRSIESEMIGRFLKDVRECDQTGFLSVLTSSCIRYLGLKADGSGALSLSGDMVLCEAGDFCRLASDDICREFLMDVLDTERDGKPSHDRMVAMEDTGFWGLIKEFHHQTILNFPKLYKTIVLLPVLYIITLVRFLRNNKKIRGGQKTGEVIKKANERSELVKRIRSLP